MTSGTSGERITDRLLETERARQAAEAQLEETRGQLAREREAHRETKAKLHRLARLALQVSDDRSSAICLESQAVDATKRAQAARQAESEHLGQLHMYASPLGAEGTE